MADSVWSMREPGTNLAVLADCHIHEGGAQFPEALFPRLQGADLIVTLGGMGERHGLDQLQEVAPVLGVRGDDDEEDIRTRRPHMVLAGNGYRLGCVHDAKAAGLATVRHPFLAADGSQHCCRRLFGGPIDVLLHGGTGQSEEARLGRTGSALNPGSATCPAADARASFLRLRVTATGCYGQMIHVR